MPPVVRHEEIPFGMPGSGPPNTDLEPQVISDDESGVESMPT
jgi:hypothetical protein